MAERVVLVTGSNLGQREKNLARARELIGERCGVICAASRIYESEPWGDVRDGNGDAAEGFLNQALTVETILEPLELLDKLNAIEVEMGRVRPEDNGQTVERKYLSRKIDIDIIFYGDRIVDLPVLKIPHPLMAQREFVLEPVAEIAGGQKHPVTGLTAEEMLRRLEGRT